MAYLHNRISQVELKEKLYQESFNRITISFYQYFLISDPQRFRDELYLALHEMQVFGRIYVAQEGINAQVSVPVHAFADFETYINTVVPSEGKGLRLNRAVHDDGKSFWVLKVKLRDKIVADGITDPTFSMEQKGKYVNAEQFNALANNANTIVVDMRNHYEYEVGHFENAIEIPSDTFREQLPMAAEMMHGNEDKPIIMYCTGGIRCEKASAYMLHKGFTKVFHIEGGIINYVHQVQEQDLEHKFIGKNFVFDNRLGERVTEDVIAHCHQCGKPADTHVNCANDACHLLFIQCDECKQQMEGCCSHACRDFIHLPEEQQKQLRKGVDKGTNIFSKSRHRLRPRMEFGVITD